MALKHSFNFKGITIIDGYVRVASYYGTKDSLNFHVDMCKLPEDPALVSQSFSCALALDGGNPIAQAYNHLKTLPEFSNAVNC